MKTLIQELEDATQECKERISKLYDDFRSFEFMGSSVREVAGVRVTLKEMNKLFKELDREIEHLQKLKDFQVHRLLDE